MSKFQLKDLFVYTIYAAVTAWIISVSDHWRELITIWLFTIAGFEIARLTSYSRVLLGFCGTVAGLACVMAAVCVPSKPAIKTGTWLDICFPFAGYVCWLVAILIVLFFVSLCLQSKRTKTRLAERQLLASDDSCANS